MGSFLQGIKDKFFSSPKKITSVVVTVFILAAIPITYSLVTQQQDVRQRAATITTPDCSTATNKPTYCSCANNSVCQSNYCVRTGNMAPGDGYCMPAGKSPIKPINPSSPSAVCDNATTRITFHWYEDTFTTVDNLTLTYTNTATNAKVTQTVPTQTDNTYYSQTYTVTPGTYSWNITANNYFGSSATVSGNSITCGVTPSPSPILSPGLSPSPIATSGATQISFAFSLPGIGTDSARGENNAPKHASTSASIALVDSSGNPLKILASAIYNPTTGLFEVGDLKTVPSTGTYTLKTRTINSLWKQFPGFFTITLNTINVPSAMLTTGDLNQDNITDLTDYNIMISCMNKSFIDPSCKADHTGLPFNIADLNDDGAVDLKDLNILLRSYRVHEGD